ncbi:TolC family protein [Sporomusa acidovorans]|uniref:Outer membrane protein TolC n=1 Tax=Sporomusa acidovorans (strain ATCC 49682 / DSM 3132 / Mol) TaxID=1123286 RepID=A0ABZ3IY40_SPOA4|nr:TolC family protein [Sporomusa acidovorans]OZC22380.1 outer membrane protein TolC precursor [Sporomusa acidovorans DSM 3132]SDE47472.1 type I secretion outer membrane protein, TolC family [Sporomusa acidovorans]
MSNRKNKALLLAIGLFFLQYSVSFASPLELSLQDSIDYALKNNASIQIAGEDKRKSELSVGEAKAGKLPTVSLGSNYSYQGNSGDDSFSNSLRMNWQLYSGGRTEAQIDQAELGVRSADLNVDKTTQQLILDATTNYYNVLAAKNMRTVNEENVSNLRAHLAIVQAKYQEGIAAKSEVLRAEVEVANADQNLIKAQNQYDLAVSNLLTTMNMDGGTELELKGELAYQPDTRTLDEAIAFAKQNRPEAVQAQVSIDSAQKGIEIAESNKRPTVSLSASTGWNDSLVPDDTNNWSVGASASWSIFDGGVTKSKINQAESSLNKAKLQNDQTLDSIEQEVRQGYLNMKEAEKRLANTEVTVTKANEDLYIAQESYKAGVATNLDIFDAQLALTQAKTNHVQALYDYDVNKAKLDKAMGLKASSL